MLTLGQIKTGPVGNIAGVNVQDPQFIAYVNEAVETLLDLGDWWATVVSMRGLVYNGCMTWPHKIESVLAINLNGRSERVAGPWYSFVPINSDFASMIERPDFYNAWGRGRHNRSAVEFSGTQPMFSGPTPFNPFQIQVTADNPVDYGKAVTIYGLDTNGQEVFSNQFDGTQGATVPQRGVRLVLSAASTFTTQVFSTVTAVTKDITVGDVRGWQYIPTGSTGALASVWRGSQTSPEFLFSRISGAEHNRIYHMEALVKIGFEPVSQDSDIVCIGNGSAIKSMIQSIRARESGNDADGDKYETTAIRRLNMELNNRFPDQQFVAEDATFSGVNMARKTRIY
jgi:hypothetical protein